jgi:hypothetical protein
MYEIGYLIYLDIIYNYFEDKFFYLSQDFINIIRNSGGLNIERLLIIPMINSDYEIDYFDYFSSSYRIPKDPYNKLALSLHYYAPFESYSLDNVLAPIILYNIMGFHDEIYPLMKWNSSLNYKTIIRNFDVLKKIFVDKGYPVIFGEVGILNDYIKKIILLNNFYILYFQCLMNMKVFYLVYGIFL